MPDPKRDIQELLEAYLDGMLNAEERARFERLIAENPALRADVAQQSRVDEALARIYEAPAPNDLPLSEPDAPAARQRPQSSIIRLTRHLATAAAVLALGFAIWRIGGFVSEEPDAKPAGSAIPDWTPKVTFTDAYNLLKVKNFRPDWVCENDQEMIDAFNKRVGQPLLVAQAPAAVETIGLSYANLISTQSLVFIARADGIGVITIIDRAKFDTGYELPETSGLNLFRREVGSLVLYEVTPLDQPHLLELFYNPDQS